MTTQEIDQITAAERKSLVGYCEEKSEFVPTTRSGICPLDGCHFSNVVGLQLTTERTFDEARGKKEAIKFRKRTGRI